MCKNAKNANSAQSPSFSQLERQARHERSLLIAEYMRMTAYGFVAWLGTLVQAITRLVHRIAAEGRGRAAVRALEQLDDRTLADLGVPRSEIEVAVRSGQPVRATQEEPPPYDWSEWRQAA